MCAHLCLILCDLKDGSPPGFLSMGFPRQEYWSGLPVPPPWDLPNPGIKPTSLTSPVLADRFFTTEPPGKPPRRQVILIKSNLDYQFPFFSLNVGHCAEIFYGYIILPNPHNMSEGRSIIHFKDGPGFVFLARALDDCDNTLKLESASPTMLPPILTV